MWTEEQGKFCRGLVEHYASTLGVSVDEIAETTGISKQRLRSVVNHTGELNSGELDSLFEVMGELARGEKRDIDEGQQPARSYQDVINSVIFATGGENK